MTTKLSKFISYTLHPVIFPISATLLYLTLLPRHIDSRLKYAIIGATFILTYLIPLFFMFIFKKLHFINDYFLKTIEERKFPLLLFSLLSYLLSKLLYKISAIKELSLFFFAMGITLLIAYAFLYKKIKLSLHTISIGGVIGFIIFFSISYQLNLIVLLSILFIIAGIIATARLKLEAHNDKEIYIGFILGITTQLISYAFFNNFYS